MPGGGGRVASRGVPYPDQSAAWATLSPRRGLRFGAKPPGPPRVSRRRSRASCDLAKHNAPKEERVRTSSISLLHGTATDSAGLVYRKGHHGFAKFDELRIRCDPRHRGSAASNSADALSFLRTAQPGCLVSLTGGKGRRTRHLGEAAADCRSARRRSSAHRGSAPARTPRRTAMSRKARPHRN